jgi:hypothetical protein
MAMVTLMKLASMYKGRRFILWIVRLEEQGCAKPSSTILKISCEAQNLGRVAARDAKPTSLVVR